MEEKSGEIRYAINNFEERDYVIGLELEGGEFEPLWSVKKW